MTPEEQYREFLQEVDYTTPVGQCMDLVIPLAPKWDHHAFLQDLHIAHVYFLERKTMDEIAKVLGVTRPRIGERLNRFRWRIARLYADQLAYFDRLESGYRYFVTPSDLDDTVIDTAVRVNLAHYIDNRPYP